MRTCACCVMCSHVAMAYLVIYLHSVKVTDSQENDEVAELVGGIFLIRVGAIQASERKTEVSKRQERRFCRAYKWR